MGEEKPCEGIDIGPQILTILFSMMKESHKYPVTVKSGSTPVGGPVKSRRKWTKDNGRGLDKELVQPELVTAWIQRLRTTSVDPLCRFRSRGLEMETEMETETDRNWSSDYG